MGLIRYSERTDEKSPLAKNQPVSENSYLFYQKSKEYQQSGISKPKKLFCFKTTKYFFNLLHQNQQFLGVYYYYNYYYYY